MFNFLPVIHSYFTILFPTKKIYSVLQMTRNNYTKEATKKFYLEIQWYLSGDQWRRDVIFL